ICGLADRALQRLAVRVMAAADPGTRIERQRTLRKQPLPGPALSGRRILALVGIRELHAAEAALAIVLEERLEPLHVLAQILHERLRQHGHAILTALSMANDHLAPRKIHVLDA